MIISILSGLVPCQFCSKMFSKISNLNTHIRAEHEKHRFECPICEKLFKSSYALRQHINNPKLHEKRANRSRFFDTKTTIVIPNENGGYELSDSAKNELITKLKLEIVSLEAESKSLRSTIGKYKTQIKSLRSLKK